MLQYGLHRNTKVPFNESGPVSMRGARDPDLSTTLLCAVYIFIMKVIVTMVDKYAIIVWRLVIKRYELHLPGLSVKFRL